MALAVKICGIMLPEHAQVATKAGADYLGLVFAPSRRRVSVELARMLAEAARATAQRKGKVVQLVGVFVNEQPRAINAIAEEVGLDRVQLSGHEALSDAAAINAPIIKVVRFDDHPHETAWLSEAGFSYELLVDAHVHGSFGGAGVTGDWARAAELARQRAIGLAGGLTPDNVADAIRHVQPRMVDVSSGVETDGVKDVRKIQVFIRAAKAAYSNTAASVPRQQYDQFEEER